MKRKIGKIFIAFIAACIFIVYFISWLDYSDAVRAGTIVKINKRGYVFKTYEGEMNQGLVIGQNTAASGIAQNWEFSVEKDTALIHAMTNSMLSGKRVGLKYKQKYFVWPWVGNSKNIVYGIESLDR